MKQEYDSLLVKELELSRQCELKPLAFFVSWQGVLTFAYRQEVCCDQQVYGPCWNDH